MRSADPAPDSVVAASFNMNRSPEAATTVRCQCGLFLIMTTSSARFCSQSVEHDMLFHLKLNWKRIV